ncbi:MAG: bile acid:sodium symporter, partial [Gammaproteobacteria bacterium]
MNQALVSQTELLALYAGLFLMMIGVALEATRADWHQCLEHPRVFWAALGLQLVGVPLAGFLLIHIIPLNEQVAMGVLLISLCPGGVMSNFFSTRAHGNVALSSSLTLVSSLLVPLTF